ncbi:MAG: rhodanese-like domain-containing protein [Flavobacteriaceae bacterium]
MRFLIAIVVVLFVNQSCTQIKTKPIADVSQKEFKNVVLVDVRTPEEFAEGHLDNAMNINWFDADFADQFETVDKDKTIYVYCKMGGRSAKAQEKLESLGYKHVVNLEGGYDAWMKK